MSIELKLIELEQTVDRLAKVVGELGVNVSYVLKEIKLVEGGVGEEFKGLVQTVEQINTRISTNSDAVAELTRNFETLKQDYQTNNQQLNTFLTSILGRVNTLESQITSIKSSTSNTETRMTQLENKMQPISSNAASLPNLVKICQTLRNTGSMYVKSIVIGPADSNGFLRYNTGLPSDAAGSSNDNIISIVPYDQRVTTYSNIIVGWTDYSNDGAINIQAKWTDGGWVNGCRFKLWYWAKSPVYNMAV